MTIGLREVRSGLLVLGMFGCAVAVATAQETFKGKTITIQVGGTAGGGFDTISRVMANHMGRYLPGNPAFVVRDMPGGGGVVVTNHIYNVAPKDGTELAYIGPMAVQPLLSPNDKRIQFDSLKMTWIGSLGATHSLLLAWHATSFNTFDDVVRRQMIVAGTGAAATTDVYPKVLNAILGTKFKLITGYQGSKETLLAIERGEADGRFMSLDALRATNPTWVKDGKVRVLLQAAVNRHADFPDVPSAIDVAKTDEERQALRFTFIPAKMGRPIAAPPGLPDAVKALLREAFSKMVADPAFVDEANKRGLDVDGPMNGAEVEQAVIQIFATPKPVIERVVKAMN